MSPTHVHVIRTLPLTAVLPLQLAAAPTQVPIPSSRPVGLAETGIYSGFLPSSLSDLLSALSVFELEGLLGDAGSHHPRLPFLLPSLAPFVVLFA